MSPSPTSRRPPRVLLVDDSDETRQALRELLEGRGVTIVGEAAEGAEGIGLARKLTPDVVLMDLKMPNVVLMDLKMPGMGGIEATKIITSSLPDTRIIVLTTFEDESLKRRATRRGQPPTSSRQAPRSSSPTPSSTPWVHRDDESLPILRLPKRVKTHDESRLNAASARNQQPRPTEIPAGDSPGLRISRSRARSRWCPSARPATPGWPHSSGQ
jgi:CheY-like chemotaxis protein